MPAAATVPAPALHLAAPPSDAPRRAAALAAAAAAAAARPTSPAARSWRNFQDATAEVERVRARVRARGKGARFVDAWCDSPAALGPRVSAAEREWVDWARIAPAPVLVSGGFSATDIRQGEVGDCYLLAAASALTPTPALLDAVFVTAEGNAEGVFCVRFWVNNAWQWVVTDARFLVMRDAHRTVDEPTVPYEGAADPAKGKFCMPTGAHSESINEFWLALLEKCWAKLNGSYSDIFSGTTADALLALLPYAAAHTSFDVKAGAEAEAAAFEKVTQWLARDWPVCLGSVAAKEGEVGGAAGSGEAVADDGIVRGHAFTLTRTAVAPRADGSTLNIVQLRNPWGTGEWLLECSDRDAAFWTPAMCKAVGYDPAASGDDGCFWMPFSALAGRFATVTAVRRVKLVGDGGAWHKHSVRGEWKANQAVKLMSDYANAGFDQFLLTPSADGRFIVQLNQQHTSEVRSENKFASVDCAVFAVERRDDSDAGPKLVADDFKRFSDEKGNVIPPVATRLDERVSSAVDDEAEAVVLPGGKTYSLIPYFSGDLYQKTRGYWLTITSDTPFELETIVAGAPSGKGVVDWSVSGEAETQPRASSRGFFAFVKRKSKGAAAGAAAAGAGSSAGEGAAAGDGSAEDGFCCAIA
jgi:hypothetical protein